MLFWKRKKQEPKFTVGDPVLWQILPGGRLWECTVAAIAEDGYIVRPAADSTELRLANERDLRPGLRRGNSL